MPERVGPLGGENEQEEARSFECALEDQPAVGRYVGSPAPHTCWRKYTQSLWTLTSSLLKCQM